MAKRPAGKCSGHGAAVDDTSAVDPHISNPIGLPARVLIRGVRLDPRRIEDRHISEGTVS
jgi:hypothetical protein